MVLIPRSFRLHVALAVGATVALSVGCGGTEQAPANESAGMETAVEEVVQATSLLGEPLVAPEITGARLDTLTMRYEEARANHEASPGDADATIWLGRRLAYLGRYREAVDVFTQGIADHPEDARFLRHRGHRWITLRNLDRAVEDLSRAAEMIAGTEDEVEPDGLPNALGIPTSTLHFNIWYHLGLAHYLKGELDAARQVYESCMEVSLNPDAQVATAHWQYMTLRRLGLDNDAAEVIARFGPDTEVIENGSYLDLVRLYRGERTPEDLMGPEGEASLESATMGYGIGNWHFYNGDADRAQEIFRRVVDGRSQWAAFGYIAAEAEVARASADG